VQRGAVAVVADPDLGLDEHVGPAHARAADADSIVSSGGVWKTPQPRAGITTPLFKVRLIMQSG
jgi:hypothetical protein